MVLSYTPQRAKKSLFTNSNYPVQGISSVESGPLLEDNWVDDVGDNFIDDATNEVVFTT